MILSIIFTKAKPAELVFAFCALHEFTSLTSDDHHFTRRAHLGEHNFIKITVKISIIPIENHVFDFC